MAYPISRRTVLAAAAAGAAGASVPGVSAFAGGRSNQGVRFRLNARTLDGGEQVISLTLDTSRLGPIDPASLTTNTFRVHAKATSPIPIAAGDQIFSVYDLDRPVTEARLNRRGDIVLELSYGEGQLGGGTLGYIVSRGRNVRLDLDYTITQNAPIRSRGGRSITIADFAQGRLSNPEVDAFAYRASSSGMKYRLYRPDQGGFRSRGRRGRPLVVWLHGGGEGASLPDGYYDNETTLRANRGALGFATPRAQRIFSDAYVVAPQSFSYWIEDGDRYAPLIREIIRDLVRRYPIDRDRIYLAGCSNGGYMTLKMDTVYPNLFAALVPICRRGPALRGRRTAADHRRPIERHRHTDLARHLAGRHDGAAGAEHGPRPQAHPRRAGQPVRQRHLERLPVPRPLVVDLRRAQRPAYQGHPYLAVDGRSTQLRIGEVRCRPAGSCWCRTGRRLEVLAGDLVVRVVREPEDLNERPVGERARHDHVAPVGQTAAVGTLVAEGKRATDLRTGRVGGVAFALSGATAFFDRYARAASVGAEE